MTTPIFLPLLLLLLLLLEPIAVHGANYCGSSFFNARKCQKSCPRGLDSECPGRERCYAGVSCPSSSSTVVRRNSCGLSYRDSLKCATACPRGWNSECPGRERCYARIPCRTSSSPSGPATSPPSSSSSTFAAAVVRVSNVEHASYGGRNECGSSSMRARVGVYWRALGLRLDGCDTRVPWSAAFISYMARRAGAGSRFRYSSAHRVYIEDAFRGGRGLYGSVRPTAGTTVRTGDLVCSGRSSARSYTYSSFVSWFRRGGSSRNAIPTHCDFVTAVSGTTITTIGGNLGNTVRRQRVRQTTYAIVLPVNRAARV